MNAYIYVGLQNIYLFKSEGAALSRGAPSRATPAPASSGLHKRRRQQSTIAGEAGSADPFVRQTCRLLPKSAPQIAYHAHTMHDAAKATRLRGDCLLADAVCPARPSSGAGSGGEGKTILSGTSPQAAAAPIQTGQPSTSHNPDPDNRVRETIDEAQPSASRANGGDSMVDDQIVAEEATLGAVNAAEGLGEPMERARQSERLSCRLSTFADAINSMRIIPTCRRQACGVDAGCNRGHKKAM